MTKILNATVTKAYKEHDEDLTEIMQSKSSRFAFAYLKEDELVQVMPYVKCRDFLKEQILFTYYNKHNNIYGFNTENNLPNCKDYTGLLLKITRKEEYQNTLDNFHILVNYEKQLGFKVLSEISIVNEKTLFVVGDPLWQQSCFLISLYSLLLRTLNYKLKDTFKSMLELNPLSVDSKYWKYMDTFDKITSRDQLVDLVAKEDLSKYDVDFIHNYTGAYYVLTTRASFKAAGEDYCITGEFSKYSLWVENWK